MALGGAATGGHAQYLGLYLSPPGEQNTTRANALVETFEGPAGALGASGALAMGTYTTANGNARRAPASQYGGAGGTGNFLAVAGDTVTITMTGQQKYLGFWWSAGDATNHITFYDDANNLLASFSTQTLIDFLNQKTAPSWVTAIDGKQYPKIAYYGNPNAPAGRNPDEPYAYMNLILEGTPLLFGKVEITGTNFELDNFAVVRSVDVSTTWVDLNQLPLAPGAPGIGVNPRTIYTRPHTPTTDTTTTQTLSSHSKSTAGDAYGIATDPPHGSVQITDASTGAYIYTPAPGFVGEDQFTYQLCEASSSNCVSAVITVIVAPQANDEHYTTQTNTAVHNTVAGNDHIHPQSTYRLISTPPAAGAGTLIFLPDGRFSFTPMANWTGDITFDYEVCLPAPHGNHCDTATATVHVMPPAAPVLTGPPVLLQPPSVDAPVTGSYQYVSTDGVPEGASVLTWHTAPTPHLPHGQPGIPSLSYTPPASQQGQYLFLCVTPVNTQAVAGSTTCSAGQRILGLALNPVAVPGLGTWVQMLLATVVMVLGGLRMRRS